MADLSLITEFSGITITSDQNTGTNNPNATLAVVSVTQSQRDLLQNVTTYTATNGATVKVKNGTMIYNITTGNFQIFKGGSWITVFLNATTATGVGLTTGSALILPVGTAGAVELPANQVPGFIYFDLTSGKIKIRTNAAWRTVTDT
jgi:hypothetical protein